jgi:heavy metal sensor kinase
MTLPFRTRLAVVYATVFGAVLVALSVVAYQVLANQLDADLTANLTELTDGLHGYLNFDGGTVLVDFDKDDADQAAFVQAATRYYQVYDANNGAMLVQSDAIQPFGLQFTPGEVQAFRDRPRARDIRTDYGRIRLFSSVISPAPGRRYLLQVGASLDPMDAALGRLFWLLMWTVPLALVISVVTGRWMARFALAPLERFAEAARRIDVVHLHLGPRLPVRGAADELDEVAVAFNDTLDRLEHAVGEMRQFSAALAHELRAPLAALRGEIEMSLRDDPSPEQHARRVESQLEELDKLKRLIDQLLTLARAEAGQIPLASEPVNLGSLCEALVEQLEPVAEARSITLTCEAATAVVAGDAEWLKRLVINLVDNAIKFTAPGGRIVVRASVDAGGEVARIAVHDSGIGMAPEVSDHVFERFFRADPARSPEAEGTGLGLSLVKWIVDRHRGTIAVESEPGKGSVFTVRLPIIKRN